MKYLSYYKDSLNDRNYKLMRNNEINDLLRNKNLSLENFTDNEIEKLRKIFTFRKYKEYYTFSNRVLYTKSDNEKYSPPYYLYKYSDEWYVLPVFM